MPVRDKEGGGKFPYTVLDDASAVINTVESLNSKEFSDSYTVYLEWMNVEFERLLQVAKFGEHLHESSDPYISSTKKDLNHNSVLKINMLKGKLHSLELFQNLNDKTNTLFFLVDPAEVSRCVFIHATSVESKVFDGKKTFVERSASTRINEDGSVQFALATGKQNQLILP